MSEIFKVRKNRYSNEAAEPREEKKKKLSKREVKKLALRAQAIIQEIESTKILYEERDEIMYRLMGESIGEYGLQIVDNFANTNRVFKGSYVSHYELKRIA